MTGQPWLAEVAVAHAVPGRVRLVWRGRRDAPPSAEEVRRAAAVLPGVTSARANARTRSVAVSYDVAATDAERVRQGLWASRRPRDPAAEPAADAVSDSRGALLRSFAVLFGVGVLPPPLRLLVSLVSAAPLIAGAASDVRRRRATSQVLEGVAVTISLARGDFAVANTTNFLLALGEYISSTTERRSDGLLKGLLRPAGDTVFVLRDGREVETALDDVRVGESVVVAAGTLVPVDGTVMSGEASVDEAAMTGESAPVAKARGSRVLSGTLVRDGRLVVYAEGVGEGTLTARIADYVDRSLSMKGTAQIEASLLADRLVPSIVSVAGLAFLASGDWHRPASVLQADYSCALKLSTPIAFKFGMYGAGRSGVLFKGADALERLAGADTFVFDKTGTLTTGLLEVSDAVTFDASLSPEDIICLAASLEEHYSYHPLALAVVQAARSIGRGRHFDHQEVEFIVAHGVASAIEGKRIVVGSRHFLEDDEGIDFGPHAEAIDGIAASGKTMLFIGFGGHLLGFLAMRDTVRANAAAVVAQLRRAGAARIIVLTGDGRERTAALVADLGLDGFFADLLPHDKARIVEDLGREGAKVAFVGDGINDAPALSRAHVGISMHRGADVARLTADVVLLEDDIERVVDGVLIARDVMRIVSSNFGLTIGVNSAILLAAAAGLLSPFATSLLHNGTTIGILINVLRREVSAKRLRRDLAPPGHRRASRPLVGP